MHLVLLPKSHPPPQLISSHSANPVAVPPNRSLIQPLVSLPLQSLAIMNLCLSLSGNFLTNHAASALASRCNLVSTQQLE